MNLKRLYSDAFGLQRGFITRQLRKAFSLIELLVVITVISLLTVISAPTLSSLNRMGGMNRAVLSVSQLVSYARTHAMANHTYVWVGFNDDANSQTLTCTAVAGTTGQASDLNSSSTYRPLGIPQICSYITLESASGWTSLLPKMAADGDDIRSSQIAKFTQTAGGKTTSFAIVLQFGPTGEASIGKTTGNSRAILIGLQPSLSKDEKNIAALQVSSITGNVRVFRP